MAGASDTAAGGGPVILDPVAIETESFRIIDAEAGEHPFSPLEWPVVRRIVHTTGDFDFVQTTRITTGAVEAAIEALRGGAKIYCDTNMVVAGVSKPRLGSLGGSLHCHVADPDVAIRAKELGVTRSQVAIAKGVEEGCSIFLIGNAPTALFELLRLTREGMANPALIVGVPVGFVGAAESKDALAASGLTSIACLGRKGGSAIAAAILNALTILAAEQ